MPAAMTNGRHLVRAPKTISAGYSLSDAAAAPSTPDRAGRRRKVTRPRHANRRTKPPIWPALTSA